VDIRLVFVILMIFSDEARFRNQVASCGDGLGALVGHTKTEAHLGPGSYFVASHESTRGGWTKKSYSKRQPMSPGTREVDRSHHYTSGVLLPGGIAIPSSPKLSPTPGPGHYLGHQPFLSPSKSVSRLGDTINTASSGRPQSAGSTRSSIMSPGSPRLAGPHTFVRDGVLFHSKPSTDSGVGPGYYAPTSSSFITKSFNARVKNGPPKSPSSSTKRSPKRAPASPADEGPAGFSSSFSSESRFPFQTF
jgi:hypothetical protein